MKLMSIVFASSMTLLSLCNILNAQPTAFTHSVQSLEFVEPIVPEPIDLQTILQEDKDREQSGGLYRFAISRNVYVSPETDGMWEEVDSETFLWRLPIASPGAVSLSLGFTRYFMPPSGRLYIYSKDDTQVLGPFTDSNNKQHGQLWTPLIYSDSIIVELTISASEVPDLELELTNIDHGYRGRNSISICGLGDSGSCNRNVACLEGDPWRDQIRAVARFKITRTGEGYSYWGTGTLINNTELNEKLYFLTSFHSFDDLPSDHVLTDHEKGYAANMVIYWNFEASFCNSTPGPDESESQFQLGASFLSGYWKSDFALVKLDEIPLQNFNVYYAGWDRSSEAPSSGVAIHHPRHDWKKISIDNNPLNKIILYDNVTDTNYGEYFEVDHWDVGIVESGSSGCPIFSPEKRIMGQLKGVLLENEEDENT